MRFLTVLVSVALLGCVTAKVERLTPTVYPAISPDSVTIFADMTELTAADTIGYERVAMIFTKGTEGMTDHQALLRRARQEAAKLGANGILMMQFAEGGYSRLWGTHKPNQGDVIAIRWWVKPAGEPPPESATAR
jgi:hypothetical protein